MLTRHFTKKRNRTSPGFTLPLRVDKMRGYLVASTQRWASCMAHAKVPVRASVSKFPGCAVGGVEGKAERGTSGNCTFSHASSPTTFSQACYALNTQARTFSGTMPSSSFLSFQVRLDPPGFVARRHALVASTVLRRKSDVLSFNNNPSIRYPKNPVPPQRRDAARRRRDSNR